ncbi:MAG: hypothetical protein ABR577_04645 [Pyrinomonadaceae bacterium]
MNNLLKLALTVLIASSVAFLWGYQYVSNHQLAGFAAAFGAADPTYTIANWAMILGALSFILGVGLLIGGLFQKN